MAVNLTAKYFIVTGRVQGVCFRVNTQNRARALGLVGWVCNLPSGQVEGVACGPQKALGEFIDWLHLGPELAKVLDVEIQDHEVEDWIGFDVL